MQPSAPAFRVSGLRKNYRHFRLEPLDLELEAGAIMGLIGPNGAGKSTLLRILVGLVRADGGSVSVLGRSIPEEERAAKEDIGFVSEDMRLYGGATLQWHIDWVRSVVPHWDEAYAIDLAHRFGLILDQKIKAFSHGQRVKASLLLALARRPALLVLDEPTTGLDPVVRQEVIQEMLEILREPERSVIFSSHNTADVERISDYVTFIDRGRVLESDMKEALLDRWRRVQLRVHPNRPVPELDGLASVERDGTLAYVTTDAYDDDPAGLTAFGEILEVERMSLEEIFIRHVEMNREGAVA